MRFGGEDVNGDGDDSGGGLVLGRTPLVRGITESEIHVLVCGGDPALFAHGLQVSLSVASM